MKYYDEKRMAAIRETLERQILKWPGVTVKEMMGCLCYFYAKKFFAFLVTNGIVITKLSENDRKKLVKQVKSEAFEMAGKTVKTWLRIALRKPEDLPTILPFMKKSYEAASSAT